QSLLKGKEALWSTLLALSPAGSGLQPDMAEPVLNTPVLERLLEASKRQQDTVARVMTETASARFLQQ
ncbi:MAG: hypothetical protein JWM61_2910, partial [Micrococcaceae bacterium]|nr:hypothetical protein [Micrococcaceae bacterium]